MLKHYGGKGPALHFSHANGFPPGAYSQLLEEFCPEFSLWVSHHRPLWDEAAPETLHSWEVMADDLVVELQRLDEPVVGIGHSMGAAVQMMAAMKRPDLFAGLVLIEPVLIKRRYLAILSLINRVNPAIFPLVRRTLQRTSLWPDVNQAFRHFRRKRVFSRISDDVLWDYVNHGTRTSDQLGEELRDGSSQVELVYGKDWEARVYTQVPDMWGVLTSLDLPVLGFRGNKTDTLLRSAWRSWQKKAPGHTHIEFDGLGHLLPFEEPQHVAGEIKGWLMSQPLASWRQR